MIKRLLILTLLFSVVSCNFHIEKRRYFKGYHVEIQNSNYNIPKKSEVAIIGNNPTTESVSESINFNKTSVSLSENNSTSTKTNSALELVNFSKTLEAQNKKTISPKKTNFVANQLQTKSHNSIAKKRKSNSDGYLFALFALIGLSMLALLQKFKFNILKISNWAARNKYKTQVLIGALQIAYISLGIALGKELHNFGYNFSNASYYAFAGLFTLGIVAYYIQKFSKKMDLLKSFFRKKMIFLSLTLASIMMTIGIGNKVGEGNQTKSPLGYIVEKLHNESKAKQSNLKTYTNAQIEQRTKSPDNTDKGLVGLYIFLIVLTAILTVILACVLLCMATLGVADPASFLYVTIALIICIAGLVMSIVALSKLKKRMNEERKDQKSDTNPTF